MRPHAFKMPIQVSLRLFDSEEEQTIELPDNATGLTVKEWVRDTCGLEVQKQKAVVFPGGTKVLEDGDLLSSDSQFLRIKIGYVGGGASAAAAADSYWHFAPPLPADSTRLLLQLRTLTGKFITLVVESSDTIDSLKVKFQNSTGMTPRNFIFKGKQLDGDRTLADHNIQSGTVLHVTLPFRGS